MKDKISDKIFNNNETQEYTIIYEGLYDGLRRYCKIDPTNNMIMGHFWYVPNLGPKIYHNDDDEQVLNEIETFKNLKPVGYKGGCKESGVESVEE